MLSAYFSGAFMEVVFKPKLVKICHLKCEVKISRDIGWGFARRYYGWSPRREIEKWPMCTIRYLYKCGFQISPT